ncbi:helix-turn-helix transcriptional regulator [Deinococcus arenicola]|uniref:Helix-turn-helix domain-containing protein n=1 Tax=Deinococcus arenicola TaxID=2994950 RepID=A0ABU4DVW1_9DEIO|nr:helix-turn-helix domain-containing protein [Deinococcus sp. ZS9-10]MDV6376577.1 helix-turn-helix domain-containing protein [Deinococcus sp. ZS9-10]
MTLPDKALFTIRETCEHLALSRSSIQRLINEGQLTRVHPRPKAARITRESLAAHLTRSATPGAVRAASVQGSATQAQARATAAGKVKQEKKKGLLSRWGLTG